jgi:hypothetical protein
LPAVSRPPDEPVSEQDCTSAKLNPVALAMSSSVSPERCCRATSSQSGWVWIIPHPTAIAHPAPIDQTSSSWSPSSRMLRFSRPASPFKCCASASTRPADTAGAARPRTSGRSTLSVPDGGRPVRLRGARGAACGLCEGEGDGSRDVAAVLMTGVSDGRLAQSAASSGFGSPGHRSLSHLSFTL